MRIALDLTAVPPNAGGVGTYVSNLALELGRLHTTDRFVFIGSPAMLERLATGSPLIEQHPVTLSSIAVRLAWEQVRLPALLEQLRIDVLHSPHYTVPLRGRTTSVVTWHDMTFDLYPELHTRAKRVFFPRMMSLSARRAAFVIADSESTRQDILRLRRLDPAKVMTVPLAASDAFSPRSPEEIAEMRLRLGMGAAPYLLFVGVFEPRKNIPALLDAFARVAANDEDLTLVLAGKRGWMYDEIFERARALRLGDRIRFLGHVALGDLPILYSGAAAFVYPSLYEGFGLPVLEAMQCGAPVITSSVSSMAEIAEGGAMLVNPVDVSAISEAIVRIRREDGLARSLSIQARRRASDFSWARCARETHAVYRAAAATRSHEGTTP